MNTSFTIRVTEEMQREVAHYRLACEAHTDAETEVHARYWEREMDRHRANLMDILDRRLGDLHLPARNCSVIFVRPKEDDGE